MIYFYQFAITIVIILFLPFFTLWIYFRKGAMTGLSERFTIYNPSLKIKLKEKYTFWVHAASVGEVKLLGAIPEFPAEKTLITCTTVSGKKLACELFPRITAVLMPLDFIFLIRRLLYMIKPEKVIIFETELWPGFIYALKDSDTILVNARLSKTRLPVYLLFKKYFLKILMWINTIYASDKDNYDRFRQIGVPGRRLKILENLKYCYDKPDIEGDKRLEKPEHRVIVCGSTRIGEEEPLIAVYERLKKKYNGLSLVISPRHLKRTEEVKDLINAKGLVCTMWSGKTGKLEPGETVLVDTMGELPKIYSLSTVSFVGGSLVPVGGHNVIEAAVWGVPVVIGRHFWNFTSIVTLFREKAGLKVAADRDDLYNILDNILENNDIRQSMGRSNAVLAKNMKQQTEEKLKNMIRQVKQ
ncbi:MAG: glycosyltransferase N-terminal domain-containing protein [Elusimicrobiota bacterium]